MEFAKWPSIPRLSKEKVTVTEKIDGSNSCIRIRPYDPDHDHTDWLVISNREDTAYTIWAQSRTRFLKATKEQDNFGFASWVKENSRALIDILGPGDHYGEWWGSKIQRGYGLANGERAFSLFNANRWSEVLHHNEPRTEIPNLYVVPTLFTGSLYDLDIKALRDELNDNGSHVQPGFKAEGMVIYLRELNASYKVLLENDDIHKWEVNG